MREGGREERKHEGRREREGPPAIAITSKP